MKSSVSTKLENLVESLNKLIENGFSKFEICDIASVRREYLDEILNGQPGHHAKSLIKLNDVIEHLEEEALYRVGVLELLFETIDSGVSIVNISLESGLSRTALYRIVRDGGKPRGLTFDKLYDSCMALRENT